MITDMIYSTSMILQLYEEYVAKMLVIFEALYGGMKSLSPFPGIATEATTVQATQRLSWQTQACTFIERRWSRFLKVNPPKQPVHTHQGDLRQYDERQASDALTHLVTEAHSSQQLEGAEHPNKNRRPNLRFEGAPTSSKERTMNRGQA